MPDRSITLNHRLWKDKVELTKALMTIFEFGEDNDGQIVFYTNCRNTQTKILDDNGRMRGMAFGIEEFPEEEED